MEPPAPPTADHGSIVNERRRMEVFRENTDEGVSQLNMCFKTNSTINQCCKKKTNLPNLNLYNLLGHLKIYFYFLMYNNVLYLIFGIQGYQWFIVNR